MDDGSLGQEIKRLRAALVLLLVGAVFILWAWTSWIYRNANMVATQPIRQATGEPSVANIQAARSMSMFLFVGLILVLLVLFGGYALVRAGRRHRDRILMGPSRATSNDDIWSQQKPRPVDLNDEEDSEPQA